MACMMGCQHEQTDVVKPDDGRIWLSANISPSITTRTPYDLTTPTTENSLDAAIWASTSGDFCHNDESTTTTLEYHTSVLFQSGEKQLLRREVTYPDEGTTVNFIGLCPNSGWSSNAPSAANTTSSFTFSGKTDLMYAPQVTGHIGGPVVPALHFYHLLTWLRVKVKAENEDVISSWGKLQSITLSDKKATLNVDLTSSLAPVLDTQSGTGKVWFTGDAASRSFYIKGTDTQFSYTGSYGVTLSTTATEEAYILCEPVKATAGDVDSRTNEYVLVLNTEHRSGVTVNVDLKTAADTWFEGSTMGHQFVLELNFTAGGYISASATVTDWTTGGYVEKNVAE